MSFFFIDVDIDSDDRFDIRKFMNFTDNYDPLTSNFFAELKNIPLGGRFVVRGQEGRPDLVSEAIYGTFQFWWVILLYNSILDTGDIKESQVLNFPDSDALEDLYFSLFSKEKARS